MNFATSKACVRDTRYYMVMWMFWKYTNVLYWVISCLLCFICIFCLVYIKMQIHRLTRESMLIRGHIDYAISWYRSQIPQPCDIAAERDQTISCTNDRCMPAWCSRHTCHHIHVTRASIPCHKSQRPHKTRPCFMCTLPTLHASPCSRCSQLPRTTTHARADHRGGRWCRWSSGRWHQELQRTPRLPNKCDRCDTKWKRMRPSIRGISSCKWPSMRKLSPICIVCPSAGLHLMSK